jgi:2-succinyl-5-enolpyruvyl-6-hydroxy-3-cyclohexene-1-carboxylate synthase
MDFAKLSAAYGVKHIPVADWDQFSRLVSELPERGVRVLELRTDRKSDAAARKKWLKNAGAAAGKP